MDYKSFLDSKQQKMLNYGVKMSDENWTNELLAEKLKDNSDLRIHPDSIHKPLKEIAPELTREASKAQTGGKYHTSQTETEFQQQIIDLAHLNGWYVAHFRPARTDKGWRTPVSADGKGFPDLCMVKAGRILFIEVKTQKGRTSYDQTYWISKLTNCHADAVVIRPSEWDYIIKYLTTS